jgi:histone deacetylase 1/2
MDNANTREYLDKIRNQVVENLKRTAFAPSVQMTDVPRDPLVEGLDDEADAIMDDLDEDENKDKRFTKRRFDQYIEKAGELTDSEDEEENAANGVRHQPGAVRRRNQVNYRNLDVADSGLDSGIATPRDVSSVPDQDEDMDLTADSLVDKVGESAAEERQSPSIAEPAPKVDEDAAAESKEAVPGAAARASAPMTSMLTDANSDVDMEDARAPSGDPEQLAPVETAAQEKTPPASSPAEEQASEEAVPAERSASPAVAAPQPTETPAEETVEPAAEEPPKETTAEETEVKAEEQHEKEDSSEPKEPAKTEE